MGRVKVYELKAKVVLLKDLTDDKLLTGQLLLIASGA